MLDALLTPSSVAVVGASRSPGKVGHAILANLISGGYAGTLVPINPGTDTVLERPCYPDLAAYGQSVDLTVIALPAEAAVDAARAAVQAGTGALIVLAAGFAEAGVSGIRYQEDLAQLCRDADVRLLGPNCLGVINTAQRLNASFSRALPKAGSISVVSQSGALCTALLDWAASRDLGLAKVVSLGNRADLKLMDLLEALADDAQTEVVVGYVEGLEAGERFIRAARTLSQQKPLLLLRGGVTRAGLWVASAHTGYLAGADHAYNAAFRHAGVLRAETLDALFDSVAAFATQPATPGRRVALITNSGGAAVLAADALEQVGLTLASLNDTTQRALKRQCPGLATAHNPVDLRGDAGPERYSAALTAAQQDPGVDAILVILAPHATTRPAEIMPVLDRRLTGDKPVLAVLLGGALRGGERSQRSQSRVPFFPSPERAVVALRALTDYAAWRRRPARIVTRFPVNRRRVERILTRARKAGVERLGEAQTKEVLGAYAFHVPAGRTAGSREEAVEIATRIGFPVALKIVSPDIIHKSDVGGVKLHVTGPEEVQDAYDLLTLRVARRAPEARLTGVTVEAMCSEGLHVVLGITDDPRFGPLLVFGLGGTYVDRLEGLACHLAPITGDEALEMLAETRSYALLREARGQAEVDLQAVTTALQRLSQLAVDFPEIQDLNINPLIVPPPGRDAMVVDASLTLRRRRP